MLSPAAVWGAWMIRIPVEQVIEKIKTEGNLSDAEIDERIKKKISQLSGLISREGAAHIICNELGLKLFDAVSGKLKVGSILPGMRDVELVGKVQQVYEVREFQSGDRTGKVGSLVIGDDTGTIRLVLWGGQADKMASITNGTIIRIKSAYVKENNGRKEVHLGDRGELAINPEGERVGEVKQAAPVRKSIKDLLDTDADVELMGTIVQIYDPRFFAVCPQCSKKVLQKPEGTVCTTHGTVKEAYACVLSLVLDDGTSNMRTVFFREQFEKLIGKASEEVQQFRILPDSFGEVKHDLLGRQIKVNGRIKKNEMFDRREFMVRQVFTNPDPVAELQRIGGGE